MAQKAITTITAKKKMLLARAGKLELPPIKQMAFGSAGRMIHSQRALGACRFYQKHRTVKGFIPVSVTSIHAVVCSDDNG